MILTDYFLPEKDIQWELTKQLGVRHAVVRLPEDESFDITQAEHIKNLTEKYLSYGLKPLVVEPMPNSVHEHIKLGDAKRDESIDKVIKMIPLLAENGYETICTNFMAKIGWYRTSVNLEERGGAKVTGFKLKEAEIDQLPVISEKELWDNLNYFLKAIMPTAEKYNINIALHPDDPPVHRIATVSRILTSMNNFQKALDLYPSEKLGITMCQATFVAMGEDVYQCIKYFGQQKKIFFVHFRDIVGTKEDFRETFHDNGMTNMAKTIEGYKAIGYKDPVRVDHVPTMAGENNLKPGYATFGRLYAIGYLRGLCDAMDYELR